MSGDTAPPPQRHGFFHPADRPALRLALGGLVALAAAIGIGRFVYTPILPPMTTALGLTKGEAGLIASANFAGYLLGAIAGAVWTPRSAVARRSLFVALVISAATTAAMAGVAVDLVTAMALRFAGGIASAAVLVLATTVVLQRLAAQGAERFGDIHFAGVGAGIALSATLVATITAAGGDWRAQWLGAGLLAVAGAGLAVVLIPSAGPMGGDGGGAQARPPGRLALTPELVRYVLAYGLFGFGYVITATFLVAIVRADPAMRLLEPVIWTVVGVTAVPSVAVWGAIGRRIGIDRAYAIACVIEAVGIVAAIWPGGVGGALVAALVLGATLMGITALGLVGARAITPPDAAQRTLAIMTAAFGIGQIVGPAVAGLTVDATGGFAAATAMAVAALLAAALVVPPRSMAAPLAPGGARGPKLE